MTQGFEMESHFGEKKGEKTALGQNSNYEVLQMSSWNLMRQKHPLLTDVSTWFSVW